MSNVTSLAVERMKRFTPEKWEALVAEAKVRTRAHEIQLRQRLINSDLKAVNQPYDGKYLFVAINVEIEDYDESQNVYIWADDYVEAQAYIENADYYSFNKVADETGDIAPF